jgi:fucose permease
MTSFSDGMPLTSSNQPSPTPVASRAALAKRRVRQLREGFTTENILLFALCHVFTCTGLVISILGPTLTSLASQISVDFSTIVYVFTFRSVGFFVGGLMGPYAMEQGTVKAYPRLALVIPFTFELFSVLVIPMCSHASSLFFVLLVQGVSIGCAENMCKILIVRLYAERSAPLMNLLFGCFGIGGVLAPLIVSGFLPAAATTSIDPSSIPPATSSYRYAYFSLSAILLPNIPVLLWTSWREEDLRRCVRREVLEGSPSPPPPAVGSPSGLSPLSSPSSSPSPPAAPVSLLSSLRRIPFGQYVLAFGITILIFLYLGVELWGSFLATLAHDSYGLSPASASVLSSAFWLAFTIGRLGAVPLSTKWRPMQLLGADMVGMFVSLAIMLVRPGNVVGLWIGSLGFGLFIASIYASTLNWYSAIFPLSGPIIALTTAGDSLGAAVLPLVVGATLGGDLSIDSSTGLPTGLLSSPVPCILLFLGMTLMMALLCAALEYWALPKYEHLAQQHRVDQRAAEAETEQRDPGLSLRTFATEEEMNAAQMRWHE